MARRRKSGGGEALLDLARLPWWLGLTLAVLSYVLLHKVATQPSVPNASADAAALLGPGLVLKPLTTLGQYILPLIFVLGAGISAAGRRKRANLLESTVANPRADALHGMSWQEFELLVGEGFRRRGYGVREIGGGGPDGGVDLVLTKFTEKFFVQCKQWNAFKVGVTTLRELYGVMAAEGAAGGFVVTSGQFTQQAKAFASGRNIELIDGPELLRLLRDAKASAADDKGSAVSDPRTRREPSMHGASVPPISPASSDAVNDPDCPKCGKHMVRRVTRRGAATGKIFWGCKAYSDGCLGIREILDI